MMDCYVAGTKAERDSKTEVEKVAQHRVIDTLRQFEGWTATVDIAEAANYTRQTALDQLKASEADGVVMSRKGRKGYEWRWAA
jgi:DNA-binding MarR family transcriptional regulator